MSLKEVSICIPKVVIIYHAIKDTLIITQRMRPTLDRVYYSYTPNTVKNKRFSFAFFREVFSRRKLHVHTRAAEAVHVGTVVPSMLQ